MNFNVKTSDVPIFPHFVQNEYELKTFGTEGGSSPMMANRPKEVSYRPPIYIHGPNYHSISSNYDNSGESEPDTKFLETGSSNLNLGTNALKVTIEIN